MKIDVSNRNLYNYDYIPLLHSDCRYRILYGGRDSGKSDFIAQAIIISLLTEDFCRTLLVRKYFAHIKKSQYQTMVDYIKMWNLMPYFHITENPLAITCKLNGNQVLALGLDRPDNIKSTKDPTQVWYEEADQIPVDAFRTTSQSIRSSRTKKLIEWISFNPQRESFHINNHFFPLKNTYEKADGNFLWVPSTQPNTVILHTTYKQNRFMTPARMATLESYKNIDLNYYKVNTLGLWGGALKGLIYPYWNAEDEFPYGGDEVIGIDAGFNNPTAIVKVSFYEGDLHIKQLLYEKGLTHADIVNYLKNELKEEIGRKLIIVDSAAPELVAAIKRSGLNARSSIKGPDSVYKGILLVKQLKLYITKNSDKVIDELQSYIWKENKDGNILDEPVKLDDHALDAIRYVVQTYGIKHWFKTKNDTNRRPRERRIYKDNYSSF